MKLEEAITTFAGNGTVVLASSSSNESSWLGPGKNHSLYTGMLTTAMTVNRRIRKGKISIFDYSQIIFATLLGFLLFAEIPDRYSLIGYGLIILASLGNFLYNWKHKD